MAATKGKLSKTQQDNIRDAIQTTQLVKRLQGFALGENETRAPKDGDAKPIELDANRIRAIDILLKKTVPDLKAIEHSGQGENGEIIFQTVYEARK